MKNNRSKLNPLLVLALLLATASGVCEDIDSPLGGGSGTVLAIPMSDPTSSSRAVIMVNGPVPFTPTISADDNGGDLMFCIAGYTNWQTEPWTPPAEGTYTLFVGRKPLWLGIADGEYDYVHYYGNVTDPIVGEMQVNYTPYTLNVIFGAP